MLGRGIGRDIQEAQEMISIAAKANQARSCVHGDSDINRHTVLTDSDVLHSSLGFISVLACAPKYTGVVHRTEHQGPNRFGW